MSSLIKSIQIKEKSNQVMMSQVKTRQVMSSKVKSCQVMSKSSPVKSSQAGKVRLNKKSQDKTNQIRLNQV